MARQRLSAILLTALGLAACTPTPTVAPPATAEPPTSLPTSVPPTSVPPTALPPTLAAGSTDATAVSSDAPAQPADACADADLQRLGEKWSFVVPTAPLAGAHVRPDFRLRGCGDTFEAMFGWRLRGDGDAILVEGHAMMTCGTGCVGTFDVAVSYPPVAEPVLGSLELYTESMNDGAEKIEAVVPVILH